jgi:hypothetical protein
MKSTEIKTKHNGKGNMIMLLEFPSLATRYANITTVENGVPMQKVICNHELKSVVAVQNRYCTEFGGNHQ